MKRASLLFFGLLLLAKLVAAARLDLFGDEAFYYMCSQRLDLAYVDHPFMTALLVSGGVELFGAHAFGVRSLFLLLGALFPVLIYWLARPLVGRQDAWWAAACSLVIPATAYLGLLALPDVPHLFLAALALLLFQRALSRRSRWLWFAAGAVTALGLCTHYRFVLVPLAFGLFLILTRDGRRRLRSGGPWIALLTMLPGLLPVLIYNLRLDFAPFRFQSVDRHASGASFFALLKHIPSQMAATTPLMYVALIATLVVLLKRARRSDPTAALFATFSLTHLGLFFLASPVSDSEHANIHWPATGYLPLLVFVPGLLREFLLRRPTRFRTVLVAATPGLGVLVLSFAFLELNTQLFQIQALQRPFAGFSEVAREVELQLDAHRTLLGDPGMQVVVADNYMLAGNLDLKLGQRSRLFVLDHYKNHDHGRAAQFPQWGNGEAGLKACRGASAVVVVERTRIGSRDWERWREHIESFFQDLEPLGEVETPGGRSGKPKRFLLYLGRTIH